MADQNGGNLDGKAGPQHAVPQPEPHTPATAPVPAAPMSPAAPAPPGAPPGAPHLTPYLAPSAPRAQVPPELLAAQQWAAAEGLYRRGDFEAAWRHHQEAVRLRPNRPDYQTGLGLSAWKSGRHEAAERHFAEALRLAPHYAPAHQLLGQWCVEAGQLQRALIHSQAAWEADPKDRDIVISRASVLDTAGRPGEALQLLEPLVGSGYAGARLAIHFARLAPKVGREQQALALMERTLRDGDVSPSLKPQLHFAAAASLDRAGRYDEAFEQARLANEATRRAFSPQDQAQWVSQQMAYFTPERLRCLPRSGVDPRRAVLIVGMPRSGTSLVEQILASHPAIRGGGELPALGRISDGIRAAGWAQGAPFPQCLDGLSLRDADAMSRQYLSVLDAVVAREAQTEPVAAGAAHAAQPVFVTDKLPLNFLMLGLAQLILPGCRVIHCTRSPLDTCLSCYMTDFAMGQEFTRDLRHLGAFFRQYRRLMGHWRKVLSLPMLDIRYEELVLDVEGQGRRMLEFLGLPWDERCARYYESRRPVHTASREQVRRPPYLSSVGRWTHYEKHLSELIQALGGDQTGDPEGSSGGSNGGRHELAASREQ